MLTVRIRIGESGEIRDSTYYGLVYLSSDNIVGPPIKGFEETSYPEQEGVNLSVKTVDDAFDYKIKFFIRATSTDSANAKISAFNALLYSQDSGSDVKEFNQVTFFNDYKHCKIVGYPQPISEATDFWRDRDNLVNDVVIVEWTIRVNKPSLCEFKKPFSDDTTNNGD